MSQLAVAKAGIGVGSPTDQDLEDLSALVAAYDAWQSIPASDNARRLHEQTRVDRLLDVLDARPDAWSGLKELVGIAHDDAIAGVMRYSLERSQGQLKQMIRAFEAEREPEPPAPSPKRRRSRGRGR